MKYLVLILLCALSIAATVGTLNVGTANITTATVGAAAGGTAFSDDFNRADADSLGANWTEIEIADAADILTNTASFNSDTFAFVGIVH